MACLFLQVTCHGELHENRLKASLCRSGCEWTRKMRRPASFRYRYRGTMGQPASFEERAGSRRTPAVEPLSVQGLCLVMKRWAQIRGLEDAFGARWLRSGF